MNNQLSQHFSYNEMTFSQTAARRGIPNKPAPRELDQLIMTCDRMEQVRQLCGNRPIFVSSGYRSPALNAAIGGSRTSHHMSGHAVDFSVAGLTVPEVFGILKRAHDDKVIRYDQLINEFGRWIHISFKPPLRGQAFKIG